MEKEGAKHRIKPTPSFEEVAGVFLDFIYPPVRRGGNRRDNLTSYYRPGSSHTVWQSSANYIRNSADYHVESSFNREQRMYVSQTMSFLDALVQGKLIANTAQAPVNLAQRVSEHFLGQEKTNQSFQLALVAGTLDVLSDFQKFYPNLMPALLALMTLGGSSGTAIAIEKQKSGLENAISGKLEVDSQMVEDRSFVGQNPRDPIGLPMYNDTFEYEVWCSGKAFANALMEQYAQAALLLVQMPQVHENYQAEPDNSGVSIVSIFETHLAQLFDRCGFAK